jgi:hypothetical protein
VVVVILLVAGLYTYRYLNDPKPVSTPIVEPILPSNTEAGEDLDETLPTAPAGVAPDRDEGPLEPPPATIAETDDYLRKTLVADEENAPPLLAKILNQDNLIYKLATAADLITRGKNPNSQLQFLQPDKGIVVIRKDQRTYLSTESYARYEPLVDLLESFDSRHVVRVYKLLRPFVSAAYDELGNEGIRWQDTEAGVLDMFITAPLPEAEPELIGDGDIFIFADPNLEDLGYTRKAMVRMGPENLRRVQNKLSEMKLLLQAR